MGEPYLHAFLADQPKINVYHVVQADAGTGQNAPSRWDDGWWGPDAAAERSAASLAASEQ